MTRVSALMASIGVDVATHNAAIEAKRKDGLGNRQVGWLRSQIRAFRELEDTQQLVRNDVVRSLRAARLIR
jgi:hypothetical protein